MRMLKAKKSLFAIVLAAAVPGGCGTQIGNPGDDEDEEFLSAISNTLVLEVIAGLGTGEYLLNADQKTITATECPASDQIVRSTSTEHSQKNDLGDRTTEVTLSIERSVNDRLTDIKYTCEEDGRIQVAAFIETSQVASVVKDERMRVITSTDKATAEVTNHTSEVSTSGTRVLSISGTDLNAVQAEVAIDTEKSVTSENLDPVSVTITGQKVAFQAATDDTGVTYLIHDQQLTATTTAGDVTVRFDNVSFTPELKCYPSAGTITVEFAERGTFTLDTTNGYNAGFVGENKSLFFAPDGCDFFEQ